MKKSFRHRRFLKATAQNVHYKSKIQRRGHNKKDSSDFARVVKRLRDACYQGCVALEYEAAEDPWAAVPDSLKKMKAAVA